MAMLRHVGEIFDRQTTPLPETNDLTTVHLGRMIVDHRYQRMVNPRQVKDIVDNYDPSLIGVVITHQRPTGQLVILDGQHRVEALRELFGVNHRTRVLIHTGMSVEEEAKVFRMLNDKRIAVNPRAMWQAALLSGDVETIRLNEILGGHGIRVARETDSGNQARVLNAIVSLRTIATPSMANRGSGPDYEHVDRVLDILMRAWGDNPSALHTDVIKGVSAFLRRYGHLVDDARLVTCLERDGVLDIRQRGKAIKTNFRQSGPKSYGLSVMGAYNYKLRNRLPDWDKPDAEAQP